MKYKVTTELKTPWWKKVLRFLHLIKRRDEFEILFHGDYWRKGDILNMSGIGVLVIKKL